MRQRFFVVLMFLFVGVGAGIAQQGFLKGKITDKTTGEELVGAAVVVDGTTLGTITNFMGEYMMPPLDAGTYTIRVQYISYDPQVFNEVVINAGKETTLDIQLKSATMDIEEVQVVAKAHKESENYLMMEQKKAVLMKETIGAKELSRKGVGDAEAAVTKVSGVTKQEGVKNVFVRGLGDRYNSTTLNGLPLPSEDPEYKNISLDLFASDVINNIGVNKTFSSGIYGDVGGANIDIVSKELSGESIFEIGVSAGVNTTVLDKDILAVDGSNFLGTVGEKTPPITNMNQYDFTKSYLPGEHDSPYNMGLSLNAGKTFNVGENKLSVFVVGGFSNEYSMQEGDKASASKNRIFSQQNFQHSVYKVTEMVLGNADYRFGSGSKNKISYNTLLINSNRQRVSVFDGQHADLSDGDNESVLASRQQENKNVLFVNQLISDIALGNGNLQLAGSYNIVKGNEPDRRESYFILDGADYHVANEPTRNRRYFLELNENDVNYKAQYKINFGKELEDTKAGVLNFGYNGRFTKRDVEYYQFNHVFNGYNVFVDPSNPDALFSQSNINSNVFYLENHAERNNPDATQSYSGDKQINSGLIDVLYSFSRQLTLNAGFRVENSKQDVDWKAKITAPNGGDGIINKTYLLPSFNIKYNINDDNILRFAYSSSYTMPQFKEVALFDYEDVDFTTRGNPDLEPSENYNFDVKIEKYLKPGEVISFSGFYKIINNPINRVPVPSAASGLLSYLNTGENATVAGIEMEFKKKLFTKVVDEGINKLTYGLNASYLYSNQELSSKNASFTKTEDQLQGASPFLLNTDLTYATQGKVKTTTAIVFNYFSDRVYAIGTEGVANIVEKNNSIVDFVFKADLSKRFAIKLSAKNILNPEFKFVQKVEGVSNEAVVNQFKRGSKYSFGITYKL